MPAPTSLQLSLISLRPKFGGCILVFTLKNQLLYVYPFRVCRDIPIKIKITIKALGLLRLGSQHPETGLRLTWPHKHNAACAFNGKLTLRNHHDIIHAFASSVAGLWFPTSDPYTTITEQSSCSRHSRQQQP
eukprot:606734-Amphidinium_carterae.1